MIEDLIERKGDESPAADLKRMMIIKFNKILKRSLNMQKQFNEYQEIMD
jgi:hypothetical protein